MALNHEDLNPTSGKPGTSSMAAARASPSPALEHLLLTPKTTPLDWVAMAERFDRFVMNPANGVRFTDERGNVAFTAFLEGKNSPDSRHELVTFGSLVLGKALLGHDVSALVPSLAGFYNENTGIFMNSPAQTRIEMWYLMYVLSLAAHLIRKALSDDQLSLDRLRSSFETLKRMAQSIGYDFSHQGYDFSSHAPWTNKDIFRQPDAVGGYAYLMLLANEMFGMSAYLDEAQRALEIYLSFEENPWYEVPSGAMAVAACARLSALGRRMDTRKALGFLLDPQAGLTVGAWGGRDVTGLYQGWRHSMPMSAYSLESFMALPAILPVVRYQPEYAREIGAYALQVAANARHFYSDYIAGGESRRDLTPVVAYERLYELFDGQPAYAAGDFAGHKSIYGGSYVLWWAALVASTDDAFILRLDLTRADFLLPGGWPTWLFYNPHDEVRTVRVSTRGWKLYDLANHRDLEETHDFSVGAPDEAIMEVPPSGTRVVALIPPQGKRTTTRGVLSVDGIALDFRFGGQDA